MLWVNVFGKAIWFLRKLIWRFAFEWCSKGCEPGRVNR